LPGIFFWTDELQAEGLDTNYILIRKTAYGPAANFLFVFPGPHQPTVPRPRGSPAAAIWAVSDWEGPTAPPIFPEASPRALASRALKKPVFQDPRTSTPQSCFLRRAPASGKARAW